MLTGNSAFSEANFYKIGIAVVLRYVDPSLFEFFYLLSGTLFAEKYGISIVCSVVIFGFEKPITPTTLTASGTCDIILHFPKRILSFGAKDNSIHPEKNARPDKVGNERCQPKIKTCLCAVNQNGCQNRRGQLPTQAIQSESFEHCQKSE